MLMFGSKVSIQDIGNPPPPSPSKNRLKMKKNSLKKALLIRFLPTLGSTSKPRYDEPYEGHYNEVQL